MAHVWAVGFSAACLAAAAGCASDPVKWRGGESVAVGTELVSVRTLARDREEFPAFTQEPALLVGTGHALEGASCELSNDKGKWRVVTPAEVAVPQSGASLKIRCGKEGYFDEEVSLMCITPKTRKVLDTMGVSGGLWPFTVIGALVILPSEPGCYYAWGEPVVVYLTPRR